MNIKVMSFNIQHCLLYKKGIIDFAPFADEISASGADIIGLNEVRGKGTDRDYTAQTERLAALTGYNYYFAKAIDVGGCNPYGNALLSKYPIIKAETVMIPDPKIKIGSGFETRCILHGVIDAGEKLNIYVTHMGLNSNERKNAVKTIMKILPDKKSILMGDFNCTPDDKVLSPLYEKLKISDKEDFTFPSDKPQSKIDYIFFTEDIGLIKHETGKNIVSDHLNIRAEFCLGE